MASQLVCNGYVEELTAEHLMHRKALLEYMRCIPEKKVHLNAYVSVDDSYYMSEAAKRLAFDEHIETKGLSALACGTVGCLAGWMVTMPEFHEWRERHGIFKPRNGDFWHVTVLLTFIGFTVTEHQRVYEKYDSGQPFSSRTAREEFDGLSDHAAAIRRCERLVAYAERTLGGRANETIRDASEDLHPQEVA